MFFSESGFPLTSRMFSGMAKGPEFLAKTVSESSPSVPWWDRPLPRLVWGHRVRVVLTARKLS